MSGCRCIEGGAWWVVRETIREGFGLLNYQVWLQDVPDEITGDALWRSEVYRVSLFLGDLAWHDAAKLAEATATRSISDQLLRSAGSISANVCEGYSRASGKDQARFYEYALGSARETRDWYYKTRHLLGPDVTDHRLKLCAQTIRQLLRMIPKYRGKVISESLDGYNLTDPPDAEFALDVTDTAND